MVGEGEGRGEGEGEVSFTNLANLIVIPHQTIE